MYSLHVLTQVKLRMTTTLLKFGVVMGAIVAGFAMGFHVLLRGSISCGQVFYQLFSAMLGDISFFDIFLGTRFEDVAFLLLVVYLSIVTVMLLNLLIAILSAVHAEVRDNVAGEFRVSKARLVEHYRLVVQKDLLPAPFNLIQLVAGLVKIVVSPFPMLRGRSCAVQDGVERVCDNLRSAR